MTYTEELASEVRAKYNLSSWTIERYRQNNEIPDRIFLDAKVKVPYHGMGMKEARRFLNMTQKEAIAGLKAQGLDFSRQSFYNWETGRVKPTKAYLTKIMKFYEKRINTAKIIKYGSY